MDFGNDWVQVFSFMGQFLFQFGRSGRGDGEFNWLIGVVMDVDDCIIVSDLYNYWI